MAWQGSQGYFSSARSPHDARMGRVIGQLRNITQTLPLALLPVCAYAFLHHADFADQAAGAHVVLQGIEAEQIRSQLTVTVASSYFLPTGILGLFAAVMLALPELVKAKLISRDTLHTIIFTQYLTIFTIN